MGSRLALRAKVGWRGRPQRELVVRGLRFAVPRAGSRWQFGEGTFALPVFEMGSEGIEVATPGSFGTVGSRRRSGRRFHPAAAVAPESTVVLVRGDLLTACFIRRSPRVRGQREFERQASARRPRLSTITLGELRREK